MRLRSLTPIVVIFGLSTLECNSSGSSSTKLSATPTLFTSATAVVFGEEFNSGTYIGTSAEGSITLTNMGLPPLVISSVSQSGSAAFTIVGPDDPNQNPISVLDGGESAAIAVYFAPTQPQQYNGSFTINSNAQNTPAQVILLAGCGIEPDAGNVTYCQFDAGS